MHSPTNGDSEGNVVPFGQWTISSSAPPPCPRCGGADQRYTWRQFADGTWHIAAWCVGCGKFRNWATRTDANVASANATAQAPHTHR